MSQAAVQTPTRGRNVIPLQASCHTTGDDAAALEPRDLTIALIGQPNVGKSTVFNMLTGLSQHVGNWPGKTVEQKTGIFRYDGAAVGIVDLPGTYSLTANSVEERIARDYVIRERPDAVLVVVNAAELERNLYLVAELLSLPQPVVLGLNMLDVAEEHGIKVEPHVLSAALGIPVVPLVATRNQGIRELVQAAVELAGNPDEFHANRPAIRPDHAPVLAAVEELIGEHGPAGYPPDWLALKLLEGDTEITAMMERALPAEAWEAVHAILLQHEDAYLDIAGGRYEWIGRMMRAAVTRPRAGAITRTDRIDRVATHPLVGLLMLLAMFGGVFWVTYAVATPIVDWLAATLLDPAAGLIRTTLAGAPSWISGLLADGVIGGAGTVLSFLPILVIFFAMLGLLEDVGYMARAAYVMDRFMHLMGLHGKSFLPLFLGFGCNVPAVLGTRIIEERRSRLLTTMLAPLVPCTARLAVLAFLAPAFFGAQAALVSWGIVAANLGVLGIAGIAVNRGVFRGAQTAFIMEMPLYHVPNARTVGMYVWNNTWSFLRKAGTLILLASVVVWALSTFPGGDVGSSWLASFGRTLEPLGALLGMGDWRMLVSLLTSFVAKENAIATLGILFGEGGAGDMAAQVALVLTPAARLAYLVAYMLFVPCLATTSAIRTETGSWRWTAAVLGLLLALSLGAGIVVFQIGSLL